jgi:hypothetical protein
MELNEVEQLTDAVTEVLEPEVEKFAHSFLNEDILHEKLATLFSKVPNVTGVKILQGSQEYGKDLIFYEKGTCDERRLVACVVKNTKISGTVASPSGAQTVHFQVRQAIKHAYVGSKGEDEFVNHVYVISPWPCSPQAMNSIKGELESAKGQAQFVCGRELFDLFRHHWPDYIYLESNLLSLYLTSLDALDDNSAFANVMTRSGLVLENISSLSKIHIQQNFSQSVPQFILADPFPSWRSLDVRLTRAEMRYTVRLFEDTKTVLECAKVWSDLSHPEIDQTLQEVGALSQLFTTGWKTQFEAAVAKSKLAKQIPTSERSFVANSILDNSVESKVKQIELFMNIIKGELARCLNSLSLIPLDGSSQSLESLPYLILSRLRLASIEYPWVLQPLEEQRAISFEAKLLNDYGGPLLVTGSAGYGKTSFGRMGTLRDSVAYLNSSECMLPTYVPLYQLNSKKVRGDEDPVELFVTSPELRRYLKDKHAAGTDPKVRIYLDGLDEVTDSQRRAALMKVAQSASNSGRFQVIVTSREHVVGSYLEWLPRVTLAPFNDVQLDTLAERWLSEPQLKLFRTDLRSAPDLKELIRVPLLANLTLAIFQQIGTLPESRVRLYDMFVQLMCGGWDAAKNLRRESEFGPNPKHTVITRLAWIAHSSRNRDFTESDFRSAVNQTLIGLVESSPLLLRECLQDGILIRGGTRYAFAHLSFQEFLASRHLNDPQGGRQKLALRQYLEGDDWWNEVLLFYVAASNQPNEIASWIAEAAKQAASRGHSRPGEIQLRAEGLIKSLESYNKGFEPEKSTISVIRALQRS